MVKARANLQSTCHARRRREGAARGFLSLILRCRRPRHLRCRFSSAVESDAKSRPAEWMCSVEKITYRTRVSRCTAYSIVASTRRDRNAAPSPARPCAWLFRLSLARIALLPSQPPVAKKSTTPAATTASNPSTIRPRHRNNSRGGHYDEHAGVCKKMPR